MKAKTRVLTWNLLVIWRLVSSTQAQVIYSTTGSTYSQNFDTLASSGASISWVNNSTLPGWFLYRQPAPGTDITTYAAGTGSSGTGSFYSFGVAGSAERALGGVGSGGTYFGSPANGAVAGWIAVGFANNTGQTLKQFSVNYAGEQWRDGGVTAAQTMRFEYGWGGSFTTVGAWTAPGSTFDWASPVVSGSVGAVDGNTSGRVLGRGGVISGLNWAAGETLWLRWVEVNDPGNDHGLAIDDFSFVAAVPEPASMASWTGLGLLLLALTLCSSRRGHAN
jgi:hypothetical protein